jgi:ABC-2 type transport system ATP-binding protein
LLGPNGAGKTTILDILLGLQQADAGEIRLMGRGAQEAIGAGMVGAVLQEGALLPGVTVRELVGCMAAMQPRPMPIAQVIRFAELDGLLTRRTDRLSGGESQRVRFALALVGDPDVLVLDEPTAAMDITARRSFWKAVRSLAADGRTVLFSTHYLEEADAVADRIVLLGAGRIVADGPVTEIRSVVGVRQIQCTIPEADRGLLLDLPGVREVTVQGSRITLLTTDADAALRRLLVAWPEASDFEVTAASLAEAVHRLTSGDEEPQNEATPAYPGVG